MVVEIRWSHGCGKLCCQVVLLSWQMTRLVAQHDSLRHRVWYSGPLVFSWDSVEGKASQEVSNAI